MITRDPFQTCVLGFLSQSHAVLYSHVPQKTGGDGKKCANVADNSNGRRKRLFRSHAGQPDTKSPAK